MEIPIKNAFISKAIKEDKTFCNNYYKSSKFITLSPKSISFASHINDLKHNYEYSTIYHKFNQKKNLLKKNEKFFKFVPNKTKNQLSFR